VPEESKIRDPNDIEKEAYKTFVQKAERPNDPLELELCAEKYVHLPSILTYYCTSDLLPHLQHAGTTRHKYIRHSNEWLSKTARLEFTRRYRGVLLMLRVINRMDYYQIVEGKLVKHPKHVYVELNELRHNIRDGKLGVRDVGTQTEFNQLDQTAFSRVPAKNSQTLKSWTVHPP